MEINNCIMIVDDNPIDQKITSQVLKKNYHPQEIVIMDNAKNALSFLKDHIHSEKNMQILILLDMDMPEINGLGFLEEFAKFNSAFKTNCKIVVLTASEVERDLAELQAHQEVIKLIHKPLKIESLQEFIG